MRNTIKRIWNWLSSALVGIVVLLAIALVGVRLVGLEPYVVLSGSMEPTYHVGSLIYVKSVDYQTLQVGDPITYMISQNTVVTHRIIEVLVDEEDPDTIRSPISIFYNAIVCHNLRPKGIRPIFPNFSMACITPCYHVRQRTNGAKME